jgi:hypothetical protein
MGVPRGVGCIEFFPPPEDEIAALKRELAALKKEVADLKARGFFTLSTVAQEAR